MEKLVSVIKWTAYCYDFSNIQILYERTLKDTDILNTRFTKLQQDFEQQVLNCDGLNQENQTRVAELKVWRTSETETQYLLC